MLNELALFAGAGGGILGGKLLGWRTVCAVEIDTYCASVLVQRQNDGLLEPFPVWDDVRTFDGNPWRGIVDVVSGGFPCQDISCAGKGAGLDGERSGLWSEFARIIGEVRPSYAFIENSPMLTLRGADRVIADLAAMGMSCRWGVISAADAGAPHLRERIWIVAHSAEQRRRDGELENEQSGRAETECAGEDVADADEPGLAQRVMFAGSQRSQGCRDSRKDLAVGGWWESEPDVGRVANGVAARVDRLKALGNGQVPAVARLAWEILSKA